MIISDTHNFIFVHIPKCAGTYVRNMLEPYDDTAGAFTGRVDNHPELGLLDYVHIPLRVLQQHFPSEFERFRTYSSFACLRNPFDRFPSSVSQRISMYKRTRIHTLSQAEIQREVEETIDYLSRHESITDPAFIHFARQSDFLEFNGDRIVQHLYTVHNVDEMLRTIGKLIGTELIEGALSRPLNQALVFRNEGLRIMIQTLRPILGGAVSSMVPESIKKRIRQAAYTPRMQKTPDIFNSDSVKDFIRDYFQRDIEIYAMTRDRDLLTAITPKAES